MAMRTRHAIVIWPFITHADVTATILIGRGVKSLNTVKRSGVALAVCNLRTLMHRSAWQMVSYLVRRPLLEAVCS
ncbi:hypothetical protein F4801DRAFT_549004 [Xylaria longipes]|nr:hypothetical protein F4801DRAFT_549004 [Xylaria longipes]